MYFVFYIEEKEEEKKKNTQIMNDEQPPIYFSMFALLLYSIFLSSLIEISISIG